MVLEEEKEEDLDKSDDKLRGKCSRSMKSVVTKGQVLDVNCNLSITKIFFVY